MLKLDVRLDIKEVQKYLTDVQRKRVPKAASRAINKTLTNVRTEASKGIRQERALKAGVVRKAMSMVRATTRKLAGALVASGRPIPLREYAARRTKKGATVKVSPGGRKRVTHHGNKGFIVDRIGGHVFARQGRGRLPIKKLYGPSIPATFLKDKVVAAMHKVAGTNWPKRFAEELRHELTRGR